MLIRPGNDTPSPAGCSEAVRGFSWVPLIVCQEQPVRLDHAPAGLASRPVKNQSHEQHYGDYTRDDDEELPVIGGHCVTLPFHTLSPHFPPSDPPFDLSKSLCLVGRLVQG